MHDKNSEKRDLKRLEAYPAIAVYETDLTTDRKTIRRQRTMLQMKEEDKTTGGKKQKQF